MDTENLIGEKLLCCCKTKENLFGSVVDLFMGE